MGGNWPAQCVISKNTADTVSTSWGESEVVVQAAIASGAETPAYVAAFDEAFLELAVQGQSGFDAAGDAGPTTTATSSAPPAWWSTPRPTAPS